MVPGAGLEPARSCDREILSLLCLPIPPPGPIRKFFIVGIGTLLDQLQREISLNVEAVRIVTQR